MGLDMYAHRIQQAPEKPVDFTFEDGAEGPEIFYWRKHPNLHGWMEALYREKGGTDSDFNTVPVLLTPDDIDKLEKAVEGEELPHTSGFFFGASDASDKERDREFIAEARKVFAEGDHVYYTSWW